MVLGASTTAAAGRTMRFGMIRCSTSVAEMATRTAQKNGATRASAGSPKRKTQGARSNAVTLSTSGYRHGIFAAQWRQRPRSSANETSGMLSYHSSDVPHATHAEPGGTTERRSGTLAATTFRKLPNARPGRNAIAANATPISGGPAVPEGDVVGQHEALPGVRGRLVECERDRQRGARRPRRRRAVNGHVLRVLARRSAAAAGEPGRRHGRSSARNRPGRPEGDRGRAPF